MKRWMTGSLVFCMIFMACNSGQTQIIPYNYGGCLWPVFLPVARIASAFPALYYTPSYPTMPFLPVPSFIPQPLPVASWPPFSRRPLMAPMTLPPPLFRNAAATITIIFDPALSVVNVSALPIASIIPTAAVVTTSPVPTLAPTAALALIPALIPPSPPYTQTQTISTTAVLPTAVSPAATPVVPGLTALLTGI